MQKLGCSLESNCNWRRRNSIESDGSLTLTEQLLEVKKRNRDMHHHFKGRIPVLDLCLADFTCTLFKDSFPIVGKLYLTAQHLCFHSYVKDTRIVIHVAQVQSIKQQKVIGLPAGLKLAFGTGREDIVFQHFFFPRNAERCIREVVAAYDRFDLGSKDSACDLGAQTLTARPTHQTVPRYVQRKISQMLEPCLSSDEDEEKAESMESALQSQDASPANEISLVLLKREMVFLFLAFSALLLNLYCVVKASYLL